MVYWRRNIRFFFFLTLASFISLAIVIATFLFQPPVPPSPPNLSLSLFLTWRWSSSCYGYDLFSFSSCNFHLFFLLLFLTSKHQNPTELNRNWLQSSWFGIPSHQSVSVPNIAKPTSSVQCKNCLQHQPQTDYTPWCLSFKKFSTILGFLMNSWVIIDVSEFWLEKNEYCKFQDSLSK